MHRTLLALLCLTVSLTAQQTATATIQGTVTAEDNQPLVGIWVSAIRAGVPPARGTAQSGKTGTFSIAGLPPGDYKICSQAVGGGYLDPCHWSGPAGAVATPVNTCAGQVVTGIRIVMRKSSVLQVPQTEEIGRTCQTANLAKRAIREVSDTNIQEIFESANPTLSTTYKQLTACPKAFPVLRCANMNMEGKSLRDVLLLEKAANRTFLSGPVTLKSFILDRSRPENRTFMSGLPAFGFPRTAGIIHL